ncbi:MAG TPA: carboxypeptidase-like regulatory domain-containing protein [Planctomycetota bacterium]|nr:carboxypeptidase-like regulatory domain-containing protein [Planctomycetota bacterium]
MKFRWKTISFVLLAVCALATVATLLLRPAKPTEFVVDATPPPVGSAPDREYLRPEFDLTNRGGTYAGRVLDEEDRPVSQAEVLLVAIDLDSRVVIESLEAEGTGTVLDIPVIGDYRTAASGRTDAEGRYALPAGDHVVVAIVAWARGYSPGILATTARVVLRPGVNHDVRLTRAGYLRGAIVDAVTRDPVAGAEVAIHFQATANQGRPGPDPFTPTNSFARFQTYVAREMGPLVWGMEGRSTDGSFRITADRAGRFEFGPVMKEIQVWVVITHPDYAWTEMDPEVSFPSDNVKREPGQPPITRRKRTVVPPGETVDVLYPLVRGEEVSGTIRDAQGKPIEGVEISLEHVSQYAQHSWYRSVPRTTRSDAKGRFRLAGLSFEPYTLRFTHPSFDTEYFDQVKAGSDEEYRIDASGGWLEVVVEGGPTDRDAWSARAVLEPVGGRTTMGRREERVVVQENRARVERVRPGTYDVTLISGERVSRAARVEVGASAGSEVTVRLVDGGGVRIPVVDGSGNPVDPATVELQAVVGDQVQRRAALLVTRQGVAHASGILPGRYRAFVRAMERVAATSEPFEIAEGSVTTLPPVTLQRQGYVRITGVTEADGRAVEGHVQLSIGAGGEAPKPVRLVDAGLHPVPPGSVTVVAEAADGRKFERAVEVGEGETLPVEIRFDR